MAPEINQVAPNGIVKLDGFDDATFDKLFPAEPQTVVAAIEPQAQPNVQPAATQQPTQPQAQPVAQEPVIKGERSVYNSLDAATKGINEKDALIEQLRQRYALTTGIDPITGQPVGQPQNSNNQPVDYTQNRERYMNDLYAAAKSSPDAYVDVQQKFVMDTLAPLQPLIARYARANAVEALSAELPDAGRFIGTEQYNKALDGNTELKNAIAVAESDVKWHSRLPGLYKLAYLTGQGMQLPELLNKRTVQPVNQTPTPQPRPTAQPTTQAVPTTTTKPSFKTLEGIKAVIADYESRGMKLDF